MILQNPNNYILIRYKNPNNTTNITTLTQKIDTKKQIHNLLKKTDLPQPNYIKYNYTYIKLFYIKNKTYIIITIKITLITTNIL